MASRTQHPALELLAYGVGYVAGVPFMTGVALALLAKATGSLIVPMVLAPLLVWSASWLYFQAFEGAKQLMAAMAGWRPALHVRSAQRALGARPHPPQALVRELHRQLMAGGFGAE